MAQPFLETRENGLLISCLGVDDTVGHKPGLGNCRREQIRPNNAP